MSAKIRPEPDRLSLLGRSGLGGIITVFVLVLVTGCGFGTNLAADWPEIDHSFQELRSHELVLQQHEYTCGAASLATAMNVFEPDTYDEVSVLSALEGAVVRVEGEWPALSVANLITAAKHHGYHIVAFKSYENALGTEVVDKLRPVIVRLQLSENYAHFVVVRGAEDGWVYISDPAYGNFRMPWQTFYHYWELGGRVFITISKQRFLAWETEDGRLHIKRDESEVIDSPAAIAPYPAFHSAMASIRSVNVLK